MADDPLSTLDTEIELFKASFGVALADAELRDTKRLPLQIALDIGLPASLALVAARTWINDPLTVDAKNRQIQDNIPPVPTKEQIAHRLLGISERAEEDRDKIAALDLVAKMFEYIPKPLTNIDARTQINQTHNVMYVPEYGEDFEARMLKQQREALANAET